MGVEGMCRNLRPGALRLSRTALGSHPVRSSVCLYRGYQGLVQAVKRSWIKKLYSVTMSTGKNRQLCLYDFCPVVFLNVPWWLYIYFPQLATFKTAVNGVIKISSSDFVLALRVSLLTDTHGFSQQLLCIGLFYGIFYYWWFVVLASRIWSKAHVVYDIAPFGLHCLLPIIRCIFSSKVMLLLEQFNVWLCTCVCLLFISRPYSEFSCSLWVGAENTANFMDQCCDLKWHIYGVYLLSLSFLKSYSFKLH